MTSAVQGRSTIDASQRLKAPGRRIVWIDIARGFGIVLVVYGHCLRGLASAHLLSISSPIWATDYTVYTFHMPLFFLLAGLQVERSMAKGASQFLRSKFVTIAYPYVLWSLFQGIVQLMVPDFANVQRSPWTLLEILWRPIAQFWFLYVLFLCHVVAFLTRVRRPLLISLALFCVAATLVAQRGVPPFLTVPTALAYWIVFYISGVLFGRVLLNWRPSTVLTVVGAILSCFALGVFSHLGRIWSNTNPDVPESWLSALAGIAFLICLSHSLAAAHRRLSFWFEEMGRASLTIYIFHVLIVAAVRAVMTKAHVSAWEPQLIAGTVLGVGLPWFLHQGLESADLLSVLGLGARRRGPKTLRETNDTL